jgi:hypothetical protein
MWGSGGEVTEAEDDSRRGRLEMSENERERETRQGMGFVI